MSNRIEGTGLVLQAYDEFILIDDVDSESAFNGIAVSNHEIPKLIEALQKQLESK